MNVDSKRNRKLVFPEAFLTRRAALQLIGSAAMASAAGVGWHAGTFARQESGEPVHGGELTYALSSDPPNLDPHIASGTAARAVKLMTYNSLAQFEANGDMVPDLAESWDISEDGLEYTFALRSGVTFHDGTPLSAEDVRATVERIQDESVGASRYVELRNIREITVVDDLTITFQLEQPNAALLEYFALPETAIVSQEFLEGGGDLNTEMMGTGPFRLVSREPGVSIVMERFDEYFDGDLPYLDTLTFIPYADENTRVLAVQGGETHIADYIPWRDMDAIENDPNLRLASGEYSAFMAVQYNVREAPFDDPNVRVALGYAFDRNAIAQAAFFGRASEITGGPIPPTSWAYHEELEGTFTYDPERAQQLLADAGYGDGFSVSLLSTSQYGMHQSTAEIVQNNLASIGIDCQLELYDWATVVQRHAVGDYQFRIQGTAGDLPDPDWLTNFFASGSPHEDSAGFSDPQLDELLAEGRTTLDQEERVQIYLQAEQRLLELSPWNFLVYRQDGEAVRSVVEGYEHLPGLLGYFSGITLRKTWLQPS